MLLVHCLSARLSFGLLASCLLGFLTTHFAVCLFVCACLSVCLSVSISVCLSGCLPACPSVCFVSLPVCLSVSLCARLFGNASAPGAGFECGAMRVPGRVGDVTSLYASPALVVVSPGT